MRLELKGIEDLTISLWAMHKGTYFGKLLEIFQQLDHLPFSALMDLQARESYSGSRVSVLGI
jgi:hypothetical protein